MYFSRLFKIKEGKLGTFTSWMDEIMESRKDETLSTFAYERITREMFVLFKGNDGADYVIGLNEAPAEPGESDPSVEINQLHLKIKRECLEPISMHGEILLDLSL